MDRAADKSVRVLSRRSVAVVEKKKHVRSIPGKQPPLMGSVSRTLNPGRGQIVEKTEKKMTGVKRVIPAKQEVVTATKRVRRSVQAIVLQDMEEKKQVGCLARNQKMTLLERKSISNECRTQYGLYLSRFKAFLLENGGQWPMQEELADVYMADFLDMLFNEGRSAHEGEKTIAALEFEDIKLKGRLVRSRRALKGWRKVCPSTSRLPLPKLMMYGMVMDMKASGHHEMALMTLVAFHLYLRPGEALELCKRHVVPPVKMAGNQYSWVNVVIRDQEGQKPDKVGVYDNSLPFDMAKDQWMGEALLEHARTFSKQTDQLFSFSMDEYRKVFQATGKRIGVENLHPYQLRHGGATEDLTSKKRDFAGVKSRGRWKTDQSVRRYAKIGRVQQLLAKLPDSSKRFCHWSSNSLHKVFQGNCAARTIAT
eukprot:Skav227976  [mRNA]  locus=C8995002:29:1300:+ [translate_table: standard]